MPNDLILTEVGFCRLAALKYALELINEKEAELGLPLAAATARPTYQGDAAAIVQFVIFKGEQIQSACALHPSGICIVDPLPDPPPPKSRKAYEREWRLKNRDRCNAYQRRYYAKNRERLIEQHLAWKKRNPEKVRAIERAWYLKRREHCRARDRAWYVKNREKALAHNRAYRERTRRDSVTPDRELLIAGAS